MGFKLLYYRTWIQDVFWPSTKGVGDAKTCFGPAPKVLGTQRRVLAQHQRCWGFKTCFGPAPKVLGTQRHLESTCCLQAILMYNIICNRLAGSCEVLMIGQLATQPCATPSNGSFMSQQLVLPKAYLTAVGIWPEFVWR